jgi:hypothetical protein
LFLNTNLHTGHTFCVVEADVVVVTVDLPGVVVRVIFTGVTPMGNATVLDGGGCCMEILGTCKQGRNFHSQNDSEKKCVTKYSTLLDEYVSILIIFLHWLKLKTAKEIHQLSSILYTHISQSKKKTGTMYIPSELESLPCINTSSSTCSTTKFSCLSETALPALLIILSLTSWVAGIRK